MDARPTQTAVVAEFTLTMEDFREANTSHAAGLKPKGRARNVWFNLGGWVLFTVLAVIFFILIRTPGSPSGAAPPAPPPSHPADVPSGPTVALRFVKAAGPSLTVGAAVVFLAIWGMLKPLPEPWWPPGSEQAKRRDRTATVVGAITGIVLVLPLIAWMWPGGETGPASTSPRMYEVGLALVPWVPLIGLVFAAAAVGRIALRRRWEAQPFLHRPSTLQASDAGLLLVEPKSRHEYAWNYFPGFRETPNLLLLYVSPLGFWMIPKRGFAEPGQLDTFKGLLLTHVRHGHFLPAATAAFPVVPIPPGSTPPGSPPRRAS